MEMTMEQVQLQELADLLPEAGKDDIITIFMASEAELLPLKYNQKLLAEWPITLLTRLLHKEIQVWDFIEIKDFFHLGNAIKYICRAGHKDDYEADLVKAIHYLENELLNVTAVSKPSSSAEHAIYRTI